MATTERRKSLGRGLSALIPPKPTAQVTTQREPTAGGSRLPIDQVLPGDSQPRRVFDDKALEELSASIQRHGVLQPIVVRQRGPERYEIVAGERRWRAAQRAGLTHIDAVVTDTAEADLLTVALVENVQREDLNVIEEAEAYRRLSDELGLSHGEIADAVGKDRTTVSNALRLLRLPQDVQEMVLDRNLSMGHARALLGLADAGDVSRFAKTVVEDGLSVRETERRIQARRHVEEGLKKKKSPKKARGSKETPAERDLRMRLQRALNTKVELEHKNGSGKIILHFSSLDQLDTLIERLEGDR